MRSGGRRVRESWRAEQRPFSSPALFVRHGCRSSETRSTRTHLVTCVTCVTCDKRRIPVSRDFAFARPASAIFRGERPFKTTDTWSKSSRPKRWRETAWSATRLLLVIERPVRNRTNLPAIAAEGIRGQRVCVRWSREVVGLRGNGERLCCVPMRLLFRRSLCGDCRGTMRGGNDWEGYKISVATRGNGEGKLRWIKCPQVLVSFYFFLESVTRKEINRSTRYYCDVTEREVRIQHVKCTLVNTDILFITRLNWEKTS